MSNILQLQRTIIENAPIGETHNNVDKTYISFGVEPEEISELATAADRIYAFSASQSMKDLYSGHIKNLTFLESPQAFLDLAPCMVKMDAHQGSIQADGEAMLIIAFTKLIADHKPILLVRNEDPAQAETLMGLLEDRSYDTFYILETDKDNVTVKKVWLIGFHKDFHVDTDSLNWQHAKVTGHPAGFTLVRYLIN